jgi:hypothetical protein
MPPPKVIGPHAPPTPPGETPRPEGAEPLVTVRAWHWPCRHTGSSGRFEHSRLFRQAKLTHSPGKNKNPFEQVPVPPQSAVLVQLRARAWHIIKTEKTKLTLAIRRCRTIDVIARNSRCRSLMRVYPRRSRANYIARMVIVREEQFSCLLCQTLAEAVDTLKTVLAADAFDYPSAESLRSAFASLSGLTYSATATTAAARSREPTNAVRTQASSSGTFRICVAIFE